MDGRAATDGEEEVERCDYCRLPLPASEVTEGVQGFIYSFCSEACRSALTEHERTFTEYHGFRRFETGVSALDGALPQGVPRNSFVLLSAHAGTRTEALTSELVWRTLERGEHAVVLTFLEPPVSIVQQFVDLDWNVLPYLESGQLEIVDCFTYRLEDRERMFERMNDWNKHLQSVVADATTTVQDPSDTRAIESHLDRCLSENDVHDSGIVVVDSLTELGTLVQPVQAYNFVKDVRAEVCKGRFVPVFAAATLTEGRDEFPHDLDYIVDGIFELKLDDSVVDGGLVKQIRARKMNGVLTLPNWIAYENVRRRGLVALEREEDDGDDDPEAVIEQAARAAVEAALTGDGDDGAATPGDDAEDGTSEDDAEGEDDGTAPSGADVETESGETNENEGASPEG